MQKPFAMTLALLWTVTTEEPGMLIHLPIEQRYTLRPVLQPAQSEASGPINERLWLLMIHLKGDSHEHPKTFKRKTGEERSVLSFSRHRAFAHWQLGQRLSESLSPPSAEMGKC